MHVFASPVVLVHVCGVDRQSVCFFVHHQFVCICSHLQIKKMASRKQRPVQDFCTWQNFLTAEQWASAREVDGIFAQEVSNHRIN